ncbi:2-dehydropantoate 2-reductase [Rhodopseudomonas sp. HC1]|uniref:ketopantoate reductase family protein n=1 Tax=Rhodopseudomonas infernalis TaxID=2897386 RepID=UPI001EE85EAE|nr:2-dehydropantoate 2-reductase [Rhodopseudomonas infernalis]MCG6204001.1 2-dehydropantoate 2-reductase [Rhodopseudomonas infernalis]
MSDSTPGAGAIGASVAPARLKLCVVGAGAIGTALAVRLAAGGHEVGVLARGARQTFIANHGLTLRDGDRDFAFRPTLADLADLSAYDLVIVAVKAGALPALLPRLAAAMRPDALLMPAINGLPWWYALGERQPLGGRPIAAVDPDGSLLPLFAPERLIGCVVYSRVTMLGSGHVIVSGRQDLQLGAVGGTPPLATIAAQFSEAGIAVRVESDIRRAVWRKLIRNAATNVVTALTGATLEQLGHEAETIRLVTDIALEVSNLAARVGRAVDPEIDELIAVLRSAGPFATSMLQDVRHGREPELGAIAGAPLELAELVGQPMPTLRAVATLLRLHVRAR